MFETTSAVGNFDLLSIATSASLFATMRFYLIHPGGVLQNLIVALRQVRQHVPFGMSFVCLLLVSSFYLVRYIAVILVPLAPLTVDRGEPDVLAEI